MTANECIRGRRSIRKFTDQPVSHELLAQVVETASYAPSWKHTQIVRYIAVEGEKKAALAKCTAVFPGNGKIMDEAPMVIAVTIIKGRSGYERDGSFSTPKGDRWQMYDAGAAGEAFCLAAHEQGLGTVIMGLFDEEGAGSSYSHWISSRVPRCSQTQGRGRIIILSIIIRSRRAKTLRLLFRAGPHAQGPAAPGSHSPMPLSRQNGALRKNIEIPQHKKTHGR